MFSAPPFSAQRIPAMADVRRVHAAVPGMRSTIASMALARVAGRFGLTEGKILELLPLRVLRRALVATLARAMLVLCA